jgi:hypothetical protein
MGVVARESGSDVIEAELDQASRPNWIRAAFASVRVPSGTTLARD